MKTLDNKHTHIFQTLKFTNMKKEILLEAYLLIVGISIAVVTTLAVLNH